MRFTKRILPLLLALTMLPATLAGCSGGGDTKTETETTAGTETATEAVSESKPASDSTSESSTESDSESSSEFTTESESESEAAHTHEFGAWATVTEPTCSATGQKERVCACGEKEIEEIEMLAHTEEVIPGKAATCTEDGLTDSKKCSVCGAIIIEQKIIPAAHTEKVIPGKAATCIETGLTDGKECTVCGEILIVQVDIPTASHNCVNNVCTICGKKASEGLKYEKNGNDGYEVSGIGNCKDPDILIPNEYNGKPVTSIGSSAFSECNNITGVTIPDSVTSIGERAFQSAGP